MVIIVVVVTSTKGRRRRHLYTMLNLQTFVLLAATSLVAVAAKKQVEVTTEAIFDISIGNQPKGNR